MELMENEPEITWPFKMYDLIIIYILVCNALSGDFFVLSNLI